MINVTNSIESSSGSGSNKPAIIGGVVGGVCGGLIIIALIWFLIRRRRRRAVATQDNEASKSSNAPDLHPAPESGLAPSELGGESQQRSELYDPTPIGAELPTDDRSRQELSGDPPARAKKNSVFELP